MQKWRNKFFGWAAFFPLLLQAFLVIDQAILESFCYTEILYSGAYPFDSLFEDYELFNTLHRVGDRLPKLNRDSLF